jgi:hypothetical protein
MKRTQTTARKGKAPSPATKARSHKARSSAAGRANVSTGARPASRSKSIPRRISRGPGAVGKEMGHAQSSAGRQQGRKRG